MNAIDPAHIERIEAFVSNRHDPNVRAAFQSALDNDPELAKSYAAYCALEEALREQNIAALRASLARLEHQLPPVAPHAKNLRLRRTIAFAVAACVACVVAFFYGMDDHRSDAIALWEPEPGLPVLMNTGSTWNPAMNAYKARDFEGALAAMKGMDSDTASYFRGVIAFEQGQYATAADEFSSIASHSTWYTEATQRKILALVAADRVNDARAILEASVLAMQLPAERLDALRRLVK